MSDEREDLQVAFEDEEYVREADVVPPEDPDAKLPDAVKKKTKAELHAEAEELRRLAAASAPVPSADGKVAEGLNALAASLREREAPRAAVDPKAEEAQFRERLKADLFDEQKFGDTFREGVQRYAAPLLGAQNATLFKQAQQILALDPESGPVYKRYRAEVDAYTRAHFPGYEQSTQALELAFQAVRLAHVEDIAKDMADKRVAEELARLNAAKPSAIERKPLTLESGGTGGRVVQRPQVVVTQDDERIADMRGVDPKRVARFRQRNSGGK